MGGLSVARLIDGLPWLRPTDRWLLALAEEPGSESELQSDPAGLLFLLRYARAEFAPNRPLYLAAPWLDPKVGYAASSYLNHFPEVSRGWQKRCPKALAFGSIVARVAKSLALEADYNLADSAWYAGFLSPLGWYLAASVGVPECELLSASQSNNFDMTERQCQLWGADAQALARRALSRWKLPTAIAQTVGYLQFSPKQIDSLYGDTRLHAIVTAAVRATEIEYFSLGLLAEAEGPKSALDQKALTVASRLKCLQPAQTKPPVDSFQPPQLLARLIRACARLRLKARQEERAVLNDQIDRLVATVTELKRNHSRLVRQEVMTALAEFAAGASHEINNPLAVISGNAQLLKSAESDPLDQRRLDAVIRSANRIHELLKKVHQFAIPQQPKPTPVVVKDFIEHCEPSWQKLANDYQARLRLPRLSEPLAVHVDEAQLREILTQLLRNGLESVAEQGSVRLRVRVPSDNPSAVEFEVVDTGCGPNRESAPKIFWPFFCGKEAGRSPGLGLSLADQLARANGGELRFEPTELRPSRFIVRLPAFRLEPLTDSEPDNPPQRQTA